MSIASEISRLQQAKADIKTAIENKGVTVPSSATLDAYDGYIDDIPSGGGGNWETIARGMIDYTTSFVFPDGVETSATGYSFYNRSNMSGNVVIKSGVTSIGNFCFYGCRSINSINIPNTVTSIGQSAFYNCRALTSITFPASLQTIAYGAMVECRGLTSVTIPSSVTSFAASVFYDCNHLTEMIFEGTTPPSIGSNALGQTSFTFPIYVPDASVSAYQSATNFTAYASRIKGISERPTT